VLGEDLLPCAHCSITLRAMANNDGFRRYLEAGAVLGAVTRARAEEIVQDLVAGGDVQREQAQQWIDDLVERSRQASEDLLDLVRTEVNEQWPRWA